MSETTNLKLKKHDNVTTNTSQFDIQNYMNGNWDKLDQFAGQVNEDLEDIENKQAEQNTNIQKNTTDILNLDTNKASKAELQEATIALQAELLATRKDLECGTLEGQAEGESLYLADSSDARFRSFGIGGNSEQEKREGYNKLYLDISKTGSINGVDYSIKGNKIKLNGTTTQETDIYFVGSWGGTENPEKRKLTAGTYTMILKGPQKGNRFAVKMYCGTKEVMVLERVNTNNYVQKIITEETYMSNIYITISGNMKLNNETFEIMVLEGEYTDQTAPEYEDYGAMPSLEFPSEIQAVGQDVNLLNLSAFEDTTVNGVEIKRNSADEFDLKGTATGNITIDIPFNAVNLKGDYTLSTNKAGNITSTDIASTQFLIYDTSGNRITFNSRITQNKLTEDKCTITETVAINKARIYIANGTVLDCKLSFKLQKGNKATGYSQHNQGSCNVTVCNRNRFVPTLYANGAEINKARANVTLDGDTFVFECTGIDMYLGNIAGTGGRYSGSCGKLINVKTLNSISIKLTNKLFKKNFLTCFGKDLISLGIKQFMSDNLNNYTLPTGTEYVTLRFGIESPTVGTIYKTQVQIEEGNATDYTAHEEQPFTMPVQEEMLEGDYLDLDNEEEVHTWGKVELKGTENIALNNNNNKSIFYFNIPGQKASKELLKSNTYTYSTVSWQLIKDKQITNEDGNVAIFIREDEVKNIVDFKAKLQELYNTGNPLTIYYKLAEPTKLPFTNEQKSVAKQIRETLHSYKGGTHVYSTDEISPIFNVKYTIDQKAYIQAEINKMQAMILAE